MSTVPFLTAGGPKRLVGMVHLGPILDGATPLSATLAAALRDAERLAEAGFDALCVENFGDAPFYPDGVPLHTVAGMARIVAAVTALVGPSLPVGVNVLRNDAHAALAVAAATGARFIRVNVHVGAMVTDQGIIAGRAHETVRYRRSVAPDVAIYADVQVKHAAPVTPRPLAEEARELVGRGRADAVIVSGASTGGATDPDRVRQVREAVPSAPVIVGSGVTSDTAAGLLQVADALIVGTWVKEGGEVLGPVDVGRARALVAAVR